MKNIFRTLLFTITALGLATASATPIFKFKTDFIITKDTVKHLRHERTTYKLLTFASNSNWGTYSETFTYDFSNRLISIVKIKEKISPSTKELPHVVIEKSYYYKRGVKNKYTYSKRISDGFSTLSSKEIFYKANGTKEKVNHKKGSKTPVHDHKYTQYPLFGKK